MCFLFLWVFEPQNITSFLLMIWIYYNFKDHGHSHVNSILYCMVNSCSRWHRSNEMDWKLFWLCAKLHYEWALTIGHWVCGIHSSNILMIPVSPLDHNCKYNRLVMTMDDRRWWMVDGRWTGGWTTMTMLCLF